MRDEVPEAQDCGATACCVLITEDKIFCANAGDSRCVFKQGKRAIYMSADHKPDVSKERARIESAQHDVIDGRVDGRLAPSRAIGDFQFKNRGYLTPEQ